MSSRSKSLFQKLQINIQLNPRIKIIKIDRSQLLNLIYPVFECISVNKQLFSGWFQFAVIKQINFKRMNQLRLAFLIFFLSIWRLVLL